MSKIIGFFGLSLFLMSCGSVPKSYRGTFSDQNSSAQLLMKSGGGILTDERGAVVEAKAFALKFSDLDKGKAGIYLAKSSMDSKYLEVYWINPRIETRQEEGGLTWYEADIGYTFFDKKIKAEVDHIELIRCRDGSVLLDASSKRWQVGCPAEITEYYLRRISK